MILRKKSLIEPGTPWKSGQNVVLQSVTQSKIEMSKIFFFQEKATQTGSEVLFLYLQSYHPNLKIS